MTKRALVMGGGGAIGIAWECGVAGGLKEAGIDLGQADLFVGTSAGSVVATLLAAGVDPLQHLAALATSDATAQVSAPAVDVQSWARVFARWSGVEEVTQEVRREIGQLALEVPGPEEAYVAVFDRMLSGIDWPGKNLLVTAVDACTGEFRVWDRASGAPLVLAVTSSCTVPGMFAPITIGGSRYIDGGVRSVTNADLAEGYDSVVIIAPMGEDPTAGGRGMIAREVEALRAQGARVELFHPDAQSGSAFGTDFMDASRMLPVAMAGYQQGQAIAEKVAVIWQ